MDLNKISLRKTHMPQGMKQAQKEFAREFLNNNQERFVQVMDEIFENDPRLYAKLYLDLHKHTVPTDKNINVNVGINKDFQELQAMARTNVKQIEDKQVFTQYEEIVAEENKNFIHVPQTGRPIGTVGKGLGLNETDEEEDGECEAIPD